VSGGPRGRLAVAALALAGCSGGPAFRFYQDPAGEYSLEVPKGWTTYTNIGTAGQKPVTFVLFVGEEEPKDGAQFLGAYFAVYKYYVDRKDHPGNDQDFQRHIEANVLPAHALFKVEAAEVSSSTVAGLPARSYRRPFLYRRTSEDGREWGLPMKVEHWVISRGRAFFVLEYRANARSFPRHLAAFERARATLRFYGP